MNHLSLNPANMISLSRLILAPAYLYACTIDHRIGVAILALAACTDWLDGFIARRMQCASALGALLDPIGDKAISWSALLVICLHSMSPSIIAASLAIFMRDCMITYQRIIQYQNNHKNDQLAVSQLAKLKTTMLFAAQCLLTIYLYSKNSLVYSAGSMLLYGSSLLTILSFVHYHSRSNGKREITRE